MATPQKFQMLYRYLGTSGLRVSALSFGNMITVMQGGTRDEKQTLMNESLRKALDYGVNFLDTSEMYGFGEAETVMGQSLKDLKVKREEVVVSTKLFWGPMGTSYDTNENLAYIKSKGVNQIGLSRKHIVEGMNASLKRLQLDHVDLIFAHRSDPQTPIEETCRAMSWLIDQGRAHYWATSGWEADNIAHAIELCERFGLHKPIAEQVEYNMIWRTKMEHEYTQLFDRYGLGTTVYSPMAQGVLSGRYNNGEIPADSRINKQVPFWGNPIKRMYLDGPKKDVLIRIAKGLEEICQDLKCTQPQLALAWGLASHDVDTLICGFSKSQQVDENIKALELYQTKWNRALEKRIEDVLQNGPDMVIDFKKFLPDTPRREKAVFGGCQ